MKAKRMLSMVLCLCMVLSCMPAVNVFAAETASADQTVTIEAENTEYAVWNMYTAVDTGAADSYSGGQAAGTMQKGFYPAFDIADTEEDLAGGFIDKSNLPYVAFYLDVPEAGTYYLSTASYFKFKADCENAYAVFMVNPQDAWQESAVYKGYYGAVSGTLYKATEEVAVQLQKGRNVVYVISATADQNINWANIDYLKITGSHAVEPVKANTQTLYAGDAPYTYGYTTLNAGGSIGGGNWGSLGSKTLAIADMSKENADKLRSFAYTVNAPADGYYDITVSFNSMTANDDAKAIGLLVDGVAQAREFIFNQVTNESGVNRNKGYIDISVYLTEGDHVLSITAPANRTSAETANNSDWCDYAELVLYGGLAQSVIQSNPKLEWWYAESELTDYTVWNNYTATQTNHTSTVRDFTGTQYIANIYTANSSGKYQGTYVAYGTLTGNYTLAQLQEGRLDETTAGGVTIYVEAPADGTYDFKANIRMYNNNLWDSTADAWTSNPVSVFMVNGEFGATAEFTGKQDWVSETAVASLQLKKGLNEIVYLPLTADHCDSAAWANIDCIFVDTDLQVKKIPTGSETHNPSEGVLNLYPTVKETTVGDGKRAAADYYKVKASTLSHAMLHVVPFTAYTVVAPYDGYYNISLGFSGNTNVINAENYAIAVIVDNSKTSEVKHITAASGTADVSTYLTAGTHTIAFTMPIPNNDATTNIAWVDMGQVTFEGGLTLAEKQSNPLYYGMTVMEAETDASINRHNVDTMKQAQVLASGGYDIGNAYSSSQTLEQVKQHLDPATQPYVEYLVEAEADGEYTLMVGARGQFSNGYKILLQVNGEVYEQECRFDNNVNCHQPITVSLKKGVNTVRCLAATSDIGWVNQDCLGLPAGVKAAQNGGDTVAQADKAAFSGNYNYVENDGKYWDSNGLGNSIVSDVTLSELSLDNFLDTSWYSLTVEAPADGWYGVQANVWVPTVETAQLGRLGVLVNGTAYEAKLWQDSSAATRAETFVYLNKGINDLIFTGILADSNVAAHSNGDNWMDGDYVVLTGGVKMAETQRYPVQGLIPGSVYTIADGVVTVPAGTTDAELKSNFYGNVIDGSYTVVYDDAQTVKSMGASQILALGNPVGRVLNYRNAVFMESSASGFTVSGELEGDVTVTVRAEEGKSNGSVACLYVELDGAVSEYAFPVGATQQITVASGLVKGEHTIKVTKGTEAKYDMIYVYAVNYTGTLAEAAPADMAIEFIGDSITVGYGLYEADTTKNNAMSGAYYSYANVAADILGADHYTIGNGGWRFGANTNSSDGNKNNYLGYIYEKNSMNLNLGAYDFAWQPDVVVINLGTNDANQYTFAGSDVEGATAADIIAANQEVWSADMAELLTMVRKNNPSARIFWVYGAMEDVTANASKDVVVPLIQNAIDAYNTASGDEVSYVHVTNDNAGVYDHPTREGHTVIGEEVAAAISGIYTSRLEAESDSIYWRYTAVESGATNSAVGGIQPGTVANMLSYADLVGGAELKKTEHPMMSFVVDVEAEGDYVLDVAYRAGMKTGSVSDYFIVVGVDDESYTRTAYTGAHPDNSNWSLGQATVHLTAGRHVIRFITMVSDTMSDTLYTNWVNIDYVDVTGGSKVAAVAPGWTHLQAGTASYYNKFTNPGDTSLAAQGDWYASVLGGYQGDSSVINNGITTENFTIYELAKLGYFSYTVEVPADGFYDLQTYIRCNNDYTKQRTGHIMLAVDDQVNWYPAEWGYSVLKWNAQNLSVYLTKGTHVLTVSGIIGDIGTCSKDWCDMGALSVSGGITLAENQVDPMTLIQKVDTVYVDAVNGKDINAGTEQSPVKTLERALKNIAANGTIHIVGDYAVAADFAWTATEGAVTVTGGKLDFSAQSTVAINSSVTFDSINLVFADNAEVYFNGNKAKISENVTVTGVPLIFGGSSSGTVASTDLTVLSGTYQSIYGGSGGVAGATTTVTGEAKLVVGGNVNADIDETNHDLAYNIYGGSRRGTVGSTNVTVNDNAKANKVFGGGSSTQSSGDWCDFGTTNVTINGGSFMGIYGGNCYGPSKSGSVVNITVNGGTMEQIFGAHEYAHTHLTGDVNITLGGGTVTRRVYGGSYNNCGLSFDTDRHVVGNITLTITADVNITFTYAGSDTSIYAHSRHNAPSEEENSTLVFADWAAYEKYGSKLGAQDSTMKLIMGDTSAADNIIIPEEPVDGIVETETGWYLEKDVTVSEFTVEAGKTLDLKGYTLSVDSLVCFGSIVDTSDGNTGALVTGEMLLSDMTYMPVYDSANGCYKFYAYELHSLGTRENSDGSVTYGFAIDFANSDAYALLAASGDSGVEVLMSLAWGESSKSFVFDAALVQQYAALQAKYPALRAAMMLTVTGLDALGSGAELTVAPTVQAAGRVSAAGEDMVYTVS